MKTFVLFLVCGLSVAIAPLAMSEDLKLDLSKPEAIKSALQSLTGKSVTITNGGTEPITGIVEEVGIDTVKLKELSGKEFYSARIKLSAVNSVTYRSR